MTLAEALALWLPAGDAGQMTEAMTEAMETMARHTQAAAARRFVASEHLGLAAGVKLRGLPDESKMTLPNGLEMTFGQGIALFGDFYGPFDEDSGTLSLGEAKSIAAASTVSAREALFLEGLDSLISDSAAVAEAKAILELVEVEVACMPTTGCAEHKDLPLGLSRFDIQWTQITDGRYYLLAAENRDHFMPDAAVVYALGHRLAMETAAAAAGKATAAERQSLLTRAYAMDSYACHFLTDSFAGGHARTERVELGELVPVLGSVYSKQMHDEDNGYGVILEQRSVDTVHKQWMGYGDHHLLQAPASDNRAQAEAAVLTSVTEVYNAFAGTQTPAQTAMSTHFPRRAAQQYTHPLFVKDINARFVRRSDKCDPTSFEYDPPSIWMPDSFTACDSEASYVGGACPCRPGLSCFADDSSGKSGICYHKEGLIGDRCGVDAAGVTHRCKEYGFVCVDGFCQPDPCESWTMVREQTDDGGACSYDHITWCMSQGEGYYWYKETSNFLRCDTDYCERRVPRAPCLRCREGWALTSAGTCERIQCPPPAPISKGSVATADGRDFGAQAVYSCDDGYTLLGAATRTCGDGGSWDGRAPVCQANACSEQLSAPANGFVSREAGVTGSVARYGCFPGYAIVGGSTTRTCGEDGAWSGVAAVCGASACGSVTPPTGGGLDSSVGSGSSIAVGTVLGFTCGDGRDLFGPSATMCMADGSWSVHGETGDDKTWVGSGEDKARCVPRRCLPRVEGGGLVLSRFGDAELEWACAAGSSVDGAGAVRDGRATCQDTGLWSSTVGVGSCAPDKGLCALPSVNAASTASGLVLVGGSSGSAQDAGGSIAYSCNSEELYVNDGSSLRTCQTDGTWSGSAPTECSSACEEPEIVREEIHDDSACQTLTLTTAQEWCADRGYIWFKEESVAWDCDRDWCYRDVATGKCLRCRSGWAIDSAGKCARKSCSVGAVSGGSVVLTGTTVAVASESTGGSVKMGDVVLLSCAAGYRLQGSAVRTCQADGTLSGVAWSCERAEDWCGAFEADSLALVGLEVVSGGTQRRLGSTVTLGCVDGSGLTLEGGATMTCGADRQWSGAGVEGKLPRCVRTSCGRVQDSARRGDTGLAERHASGTEGTTGDLVHVTCTGDRYAKTVWPVRCGGSSAGWNGTLTLCESPSCAALDGAALSERHAAVTLVEGGSKAEVRCLEGYVMADDSVQVMECAGETWSATTAEIKCLRLTCEELGAVEGGGWVGGAAAATGDEARLECNEGHLAVGATTSTCLATGQWSVKEGQCVPQGCASAPPAVADGWVELELVPGVVGEVRDWGCNIGFEGSGTIECLQDRTWSLRAEQMVCVEKECPAWDGAGGVDGAVAASDGNRVGSVAVAATCSGGKVLVGAAAAECMVGGEWNVTRVGRCEGALAVVAKRLFFDADYDTLFPLAVRPARLARFAGEVKLALETALQREGVLNAFARVKAVLSGSVLVDVEVQVDQTDEATVQTLLGVGGTASALVVPVQGINGSTTLPSTGGGESGVRTDVLVSSIVAGVVVVAVVAVVVVVVRRRRKKMGGQSQGGHSQGGHSHSQRGGGKVGVAGGTEEAAVDMFRNPIYEGGVDGSGREGVVLNSAYSAVDESVTDTGTIKSLSEVGGGAIANPAYEIVQG